MQIIIKGKNLEITDAIREYAEKKIQHLERHFDHIMEVQALLNVARNPSVDRSQEVELIALVNGSIVKISEFASDMYTAIDLAVDRLDRQVTRYKEKLKEKPDMKLARAMEVAEDMLEGEEEDQERASSAARSIVKRKSFTLKPMFPEDAVARMDELGHTFFVFRNAETERINVLYRRLDGDYGLIETS